MRLLALLLLLALPGCASLPDNFAPVERFSVDRYLGRWYEIARLDHSFERGLSQVTATYSRADNGAIGVINRGYAKDSGKWKEAKGKAYLAGKEGQGFLRVSFFGPFYGAYVVCALDDSDYGYALVCGPDTSYLWILSRSPTLEGRVLAELIAKARELGYDTDKLLFVDHQPLGDTP